MMDAIFSRGGRAALLFTTLMLGFALAAFKRTEIDDYNPWAVD